MSQPIRPYSVAQQSLALSSQERGQGHMLGNSALPGPNMYNDLGSSAGSTEWQQDINRNHAVQNGQQNTIAAIQGTAAKAIGDVRDAAVIESDSEEAARRFKDEYVSATLLANKDVPTLALEELNTISQDPELRDKFNYHIASQKVAGMQNPVA